MKKKFDPYIFIGTYYVLFSHATETDPAYYEDVDVDIFIFDALDEQVILDFINDEFEEGRDLVSEITDELMFEFHDRIQEYFKEEFDNYADSL